MPSSFGVRTTQYRVRVCPWTFLFVKRFGLFDNRKAAYICFAVVFAKTYDNIVGIKEASGNISQVAEITKLCGDDFSIYSGNDDQIVPILSLGGKGVISVLSNVAPKLTCSITNSFFQNAINEACHYQLEALPLIHSLFAETNPIPIKEALNLSGFNFGKPRLPLVECSANLRKILKEQLKI